MQIKTFVSGVGTPLSVINGLTLGLMALGYQPCGYFEIFCDHCHATYRVALRVTGGHFAERACPECGKAKHRASFLAFGFTRRQLPFNECVYAGHGRIARVEFAAEFKRRRQAYRASLGEAHRATVGGR